MEMNVPVFELSGVNYAYLGRYPALTKIDLRIPAGKSCVLLGANGTGKSTLLQMLDGLVFPDSGSVRIEGKELTETALAQEQFSLWFRGKVGFVFQNPDVQLFCPTVREDIAFGPLQLGVDPGIVEKRVAALAQRLEIGHLLDRAPHQLSLGEKHKVAIAGTLAVEPQVLLLDEPTAGLDPATIRHIIEIVLVAEAAGRTVVTATHDLHLAEEIADLVFVLGKERTLVRSGLAAEVLGDNDFLASNNLGHIHIHRHNGVLHTHIHSHNQHHI
jgi:cobalt/nickel transport system ATP-binding protein